MAEEVLDCVRKLFGETKIPEYVTVRPFLKEDPYVVEIETRFKNKKKSNLNIEDVAWLITDMIWLDVKTLQYYFPKILEITIQDPFPLKNFDLLPMQLADKKILKEKFGFINMPQSVCILKILKYWQANEKLLKKYTIAEDLKKAITYWKKRAKIIE